MSTDEMFFLRNMELFIEAGDGLCGAEIGVLIMVVPTGIEPVSPA